MNLSFFRICKKVSEFSDHHSHKIGAVVVKNGKIMSTGFNKLSTHPLSLHPYKSCHAEFMAMKTLDKETLKDSTIYVFRQTKDGKYANSKPCPSCRALIEANKLAKIVFTVDNSIEMEKIC